MDNQQWLKFRIVFSSEWILSKRGNDILPAEWIVKELKDNYTILQIKTKLTECEGVVNSQDEVELRSKINSLICNKYDITENSDVFSIEIEEHSAVKEQSENKGKESESISDHFSKSKNNVEKNETSLTKIEKLIGALEFKALANEVSDIAETLKKNDMIDSFKTEAIHRGFRIHRQGKKYLYKSSSTMGPRNIINS